MKLFLSTKYSIAALIVVYSILTIICFDHVYIGDNLQQISVEAHWFFDTNFNSLLLPPYSTHSAYQATGYHPPLIGIITAILWRTFGYYLWVSHLFVYLCFFIFLYNILRLLRTLFPEKYVGCILMVLLLEPILLSQFTVTSPDFILFIAFVTAIRAILNNKPVLLGIAVFFLFGINMRGLFTGTILLFSNIYYIYITHKNIRPSILLKVILPYVPTLLIMAGYYTYYFETRGWFFKDSPYSEHYMLPTGLKVLFFHLCGFGVRIIENGRIFIWGAALWSGFYFFKLKKSLPNSFMFLGVLFILLFGLYFLFVFISQMPFASRYFIPILFLLTLLTIYFITNISSEKGATRFFVLTLFFFISGHFWIYPERIAKSWDGTLALFPYYELRKECFKYIDQSKIDYGQLSGSMWIYGHRRFAELGNDRRIIGNKPTSKYYIYTNVSNIEDSLFDDLHTGINWKPVKCFSKWPVIITIYKNQKYK